MHIVFATVDFPDSNGPTTGLPKYLYRVALTLVKWGHEVTVVTCSNRSVYYEFYGIHVYRVRRTQIKKYGDQRLDAIAYANREGYIIYEKLKEIIADKKVDIIQYTSLMGIARFHDFDVPAVMRMSSYAKLVPVRGQEITQNTRAEIERESASKCSAIFAPSIICAKEFGKDIGQTIDVIETPFVMEEDKEDTILFDSLVKDKKYLLYYGSIIEYKGFRIISQAIHQILEYDKDIYFVVIGDGENALKNELLECASNYKNRIIINKAVGFNNLKPFIRAAYGILMPSLTENLSNACIESMAMGKIVIGTDGVSYDQLIEDGKSGLLCEPGSAESLFSAVKRLLDFNCEEKNKIEKCAKKVIERLAPEKTVGELVEYYYKAIEEYRRGKL